MSNTEASVLDRISEDYYRFTEAERKVADFVVTHKHDTQLMSISELSEACGVAEATVSRFCRRLRYKGYSAFKLAVAGADSYPEVNRIMGGEIAPGDSPQEIARKCCAAECDALHQTLELLSPESIETAARYLTGARQVLCMGQGGSMLLAAEAAHLFSTILPGFQAVWDTHLQAISIAKLQKDDAVLFFSYSGSTREAVELLPLARERGAHVILITRFPKSPAAAVADVILQCGANELPLQHGTIPARVAQLYILDVLFYQIFRTNEPLCASVKEQVASTLATRHI